MVLSLGGMAVDGIGQISLFELELLSELGSHPSLRSLGRQKHLEPPHLSKILSRLESKLQVNLLKRSPKGILLTPEGLRLVKVAREMIPLREALLDRGKTELEAPQELITVGAPRFVASHLVSPTLEGLRLRNASLRFRLLDMAPDEVEAAALKSACEVVVTIGEPSLTKSWDVTKVGSLSWGLYASRRHPLSTNAREKEVGRYPFLVPTYWKRDGFEKGEDGCPLGWPHRIAGDETSSVLTAVEVLRNSPDQLLFAPRVVVKAQLGTGDFKEIRVVEWARVDRPVYVAVRSDLVAQNFLKRLLTGLSAQLM